MSLGAFAGGLANGISQGIRNTRAWNQIEQEKADREKEQAWKKETEGLYNKFAGVAEKSADTSGQVSEGQSSPAPLQNAGQVAPAQVAQHGDMAATAQSSTATQPKALGNLADAMNFATEQTKINMKYGKASPMDLVQLKRMSDTFEREGLDTAIGLLAGGDYDGALKAYNATGKDSGVAFKEPPKHGVFEFAGQKIPTVIATIVGADGKERQINTAQVMAAKMGVDKQLNAMMDSLKLNATIDHQNQAIGLQRDQLDEQNRHNVVSEGISRLSLSAKTDRRGQLKKEYDDLVSMYGPERGAAMFEKKFSRESGDKPLFEKLKSSDPKTMAESEELYRVDPATNTRYRVSEGIGAPPTNNVGGMRPAGKSNGFQSFGSMEESLKAVDDNLKAYGEKHGIDTLEGVISRWSPANENDTETLIANASRVTGIKPGQKIDLSNPAVRTVISAAIISQEGSRAYLDGVRGGISGKGAGQSVSPASVVRSGINGGGSGDQDGGDGVDFGSTEQDYEILPKDVSKRKPGTIYRSPTGRTAMWDGNGLIAQ